MSAEEEEEDIPIAHAASEEKEEWNFTGYRPYTRRSAAFFAPLPGCPAILRNAVWGPHLG